jgi:tRNA(Ile)-lysidine synthase
MSPLPDATATALLTRCSFPPPGTAVTCAVSGGPDSTALLALAVAAGCTATAVHVDHGLRPGSAAEAEVVARSARTLGAGFRGVRVDLGDGPNLEARARAARYAALPADVLTGHTADDRAETVLVNLLRGAGLDGLVGMRAGGPDGRRRPILGLRRAETVQLCARLGLPTVDDPSNHDPRHLRNRVRAELLPLIADIARRDPVPILVRQSELLADEAAELDRRAADVDPTDARAQAAAPPAIARRAIRAWLTGQHPPDAATVERVLAVARGQAVACEVGGGTRISRTNQRLHRSDAARWPVV